ncbi:MAG: single-stranded DNA-binding protein [Methylococcaceae bacterium]|nr:single-stranded DNA-binding protein [Methylococcaceae bacterium]
MNILCFTGNLGKDAETRYTQSGDAVVSFSAACKAGFGDKATTTWLRCSMFGKRGESVAPYLTKGTLVGVSGEFSAREWKDKDGQKRTSLEVRVNDLTLLGRKPETTASASADNPPADDLGDDIPF